MKRAHNFVSLVGHTFGKWTVESEAAQKHGRSHWRCRCECGTVRDVAGQTLKNGTSTNCGCATGIPKGRHGHVTGGTSREYRSWNAMKGRCENPSNVMYALYGGRGISVCDRWRTSFQNFIDDMGMRPDGCSLDRIDTNGNYEPSNCRWATAKRQSNNTRSNRKVRYRGRTQTVTEWCDELSVSAELVRSRMNHLGWSFRKAIETPVVTLKDRVDMTGKRFGHLTVIEYADTVNKRARWRCACDCGREYIGVGKFLRQGRVVSCGCKRGRRKKE